MRKSLHATALVLALTPFGALGQDFGAGLEAFSSGDDLAALREWGPLAAQGDPRAQFWLGRLYSAGFGVNQDYVEAVGWYRRAAAQGFAISQRDLGHHYATGHGVPQSDVLAYMWYEIAIENGDYVSDFRDHLERQMTLADTQEARKRARICLDSNYQACS